jgi:hypothetical protein
VMVPASAALAKPRLSVAVTLFSAPRQRLSTISSVSSGRPLAGTEDPNPRDNAQVVSVGVFDQSNPLSSACPGDIPVNLTFVSAVIPLSEYCGWLQMIGNMLVAVSLLGATLFVLRGAS